MRSTKQLLGLRIKEIRKKRGLSQEGLAEKVGIDPKHLSRIESGRGYPSMDTLELIASAVDVDIKLFFENEHFEDAKVVDEKIHGLLSQASLEERKTILRILTAILL
jgi:transcriptional regulator with XRE-family HTH domain